MEICPGKTFEFESLKTRSECTYLRIINNRYFLKIFCLYFIMHFKSFVICLRTFNKARISGFLSTIHFRIQISQCHWRLFIYKKWDWKLLLTFLLNFAGKNNYDNVKIRYYLLKSEKVFFKRQVELSWADGSLTSFTKWFI